MYVFAKLVKVIRWVQQISNYGLNKDKGFLYINGTFVIIIIIIYYCINCKKFYLCACINQVLLKIEFCCGLINKCAWSHKIKEIAVECGPRTLCNPLVSSLLCTFKSWTLLIKCTSGKLCLQTLFTAFRINRLFTKPRMSCLYSVILPAILCVI